MKIIAQVRNTYNHHHITLSTNNTTHSITIPLEATGLGSNANGGELLLLPLATGLYVNAAAIPIASIENVTKMPYVASE